MGNDIINGVVSIAVAIVGIAILAVLVSKNSNTSGVISAASGGFAQDISAAVSPITGTSYSGNSGFGSTLGLNTSYLN